MKKRTFTPISVLIGVLLLALAAAMTTFVADSDIAHAQQSSDANLEALSLSWNDGNSDTPLNLSPSFDNTGATTSYTTTNHVGFVATGVSVTANPSHAQAEIVGHPDTNASDSDAVTWVANLGGGGSKTTINVQVRAQNGTTKTYSVTVYRKRQTESTDANLSSLSLGTGTMSPGFSGSQIEYNARVASSVSSVTVSYTLSDNAGGVSAVVGASGGANVDNNNNKKVNLGNKGTEGTITVTVTPEAGAGDNSENNKVYTIKVYRLNDNLDENANLSGITVTDEQNNEETLSPTFGVNTTSYNVTVANGDDVVTVAAAKGHVGAKVSITPLDASGNVGGHQVRLSAGATTTVTINVTAEDTSISKTYTVKVYRERSTKSDVKTLSALSLSAGSLSPGFSSTVYAYNARVGSSVDKVTVSATPTDNAGGVSITYNNTSSNEITLAGPGNATTITVAVTAEAGGAAQNYVITVYRSRNALLAQANIASIVVSDNGSDITSTLSPNFNSNTTSYKLIVNNNVPDVEFVPTLSDGTGATYVITPADSDTSETNHQVAVTAGSMTAVTITVTAEDRTVTKTYTFNVYRKRAAADISDDATLSALTASPANLSPGFTSARMDYTARVANSVEEVTISATPTDNAGGVVITVGTSTSTCTANFTSDADSKIELAAGAETNICVRVVPESGASNQKYYEITVYRERANPSDNAGLSTFNIVEATGTIRNVITGDTDSNNAITPANLLTNKKPDVVYRVREVTVTATASDVGAIVTITPDDADASKVGYQVALTEGEVTNITVTVQPEDTTVDAKTYSASVYRKNASTRESDDATLKSLTLSGAVLTPEFDPATTSYTADAAFSATKTIVTAMPNHIGARNGVVIAPGATSKSGWEVPLSAPGGKYTITITVTPETGASADAKTYTVEVTRAATAGTDATLSSLSLTDGAGMDIALTPAFDADTAAYTASVDSTVTAANVMAMAAAPGTTVEVMYGADDMEVTAGDDGSYSVPLTEGANTVKVMVTAEDAETTMTYTVGITVRPADPSIALYDKYDTNDNNMIDKSEVVAAIEAYLEHGTLTKAEVVTLIQKYLSGEPIRE